MTDEKEREIKRASGKGSEELASSAERCGVRLSIYYGGKRERESEREQGAGEQGDRGASVCVQKGEKEGHILYLWVFAATVLSRRRLAAES